MKTQQWLTSRVRMSTAALRAPWLSVWENAPRRGFAPGPHLNPFVKLSWANSSCFVHGLPLRCPASGDGLDCFSSEAWIDSHTAAFCLRCSVNGHPRWPRGKGSTCRNSRHERGRFDRWEEPLGKDMAPAAILVPGDPADRGAWRAQSVGHRAGRDLASERHRQEYPSPHTPPGGQHIQKRYSTFQLP